MRSDGDIYADDPALAHGMADTRVKNQRPAMCDTRFDDDVRLDLKDHVLNPEQVLRQLDNWPAKPRERIRILLSPANLQPIPRQDVECLRAEKVDGPPIRCKGSI